MQNANIAALLLVKSCFIIERLTIYLLYQDSISSISFTLWKERKKILTVFWATEQARGIKEIAGSTSARLGRELGLDQALQWQGEGERICFCGVFLASSLAFGAASRSAASQACCLADGKTAIAVLHILPSYRLPYRWRERITIKQAFNHEEHEV